MLKTVQDRGPFSTPGKQVMAASAAAFVAVWLALRFEVFRTAGLGRGPTLVILVAMLALAFGLFGWGLLLRRNDQPSFGEADLRPHADLLSEIRWRQLLARVVVMFALTPFVDRSMVDGFGPGASAVIALPAIVFFILLASLVRMVSGGRRGRGVDDELTATFRAEAWRVGFLTLLVAAGAAYIASRDHTWFTLPLTAAAPYVLALGAGAMAVRFAWLERAAAKDG